jgi:small-conductance mechanosensitive channel
MDPQEIQPQLSDGYARGRKFLIASSSLVVATALAAALEYATFWLFVKTHLTPELWHSTTIWILGWWLGADAGVMALYGGSNLVAKWAPNPGNG